MISKCGRVDSRGGTLVYTNQYTQLTGWHFDHGDLRYVRTDSLAAQYKIKYHIPVHAKLACPLGKLLNPSVRRSVRVQMVHDVSPCTGLSV